MGLLGSSELVSFCPFSLPPGSGPVLSSCTNVTVLCHLPPVHPWSVPWLPRQIFRGSFLTRRSRFPHKPKSLMQTLRELGPDHLSTPSSSTPCLEPTVSMTYLSCWPLPTVPLFSAVLWPSVLRDPADTHPLQTQVPSPRSRPPLRSALPLVHLSVLAFVVRHAVGRHHLLPPQIFPHPTAGASCVPCLHRRRQGPASALRVL